MALFENLEAALGLSVKSAAALIENNFDTPPSVSNNFGMRASLSIAPVLSATESAKMLVDRGNYQTALSVLATTNGLPTLHLPNKVDLGNVYSNGFAMSVAEFRSANAITCLVANDNRIQTSVYTGDQTLDNLVVRIKELQGSTGGINTLLLK